MHPSRRSAPDITNRTPARQLPVVETGTAPVVMDEEDVALLIRFFAAELKEIVGR